MVQNFVQISGTKQQTLNFCSSLGRKFRLSICILKVYGHQIMNEPRFICPVLCIQTFKDFLSLPWGYVSANARCTSVHSWKSSNLKVKYSIYQINNELSTDFLSIVWFCMFNSIAFFEYFTDVFYSLICETREQFLFIPNTTRKF